MGLCLLFTFSRGALAALVVAVSIFIFFKDKRLFIPLIAVMALVILFMPSVYNRLDYMFSHAYIESSMRGGRLIRAIKGFEMWKENFILGVGLGHFGGAVATNNNIPGTFYMDNYYLKTAVEMGLAGLSAFFLVIYNIVKWCYRILKQLKDPVKLNMVLGAFSGICGVLAHNLVENIFEVPMMVMYFWTLTAFVMYTGHKQKIT